MKILYIIIFAVIFIGFSSCQKKTGSENSSSQTNDIITELIKENVLAGPSSTNNINTNSPVDESIKEGNNMNSNIELPESNPAAVNLPVEPEVGSVNPKINTAKVNPVKTNPVKKVIRDQGVIIPYQETEANPVSQTGSFIEVGGDVAGQDASPRKYIKITTAIFSKGIPSARYVDIYVYALPRGKTARAAFNNLIVFGRDIDIINSQAEITKYWNGANIDMDFLEPGNYNIYVMYLIKDSNLNILKKDSRFWGINEKAYLTLY